MNPQTQNRSLGSKAAWLLMLLAAASAWAGPSPNVAAVTLAWDYNFVTSPGVTNFVVYYGTNSGVYQLSSSVNGTNLTQSVTNLTRGTTYYFAGTAQANGLESDYSNEMQYTVPRKPQKMFNLILQ